ncbi:MAG: hypothetical protein JO270_08280 [Acidobacteriaceae bacterium]|nr:hypothetical protein [Acidobacteriaceae bacterium]
MPSAAPYIPAKDAALDAWGANFTTLLTASPVTYGLTSTDALNAQNAFNTWHAAYLLVTSPTTKTKQTVSAKNTQKVTMLGIIRPLAITISLNAGVSSANKTAIGVNPRTSTPTPIPTPVTNPVLTLDSTSPAGTIIRYRDSIASPSVKSKPFGSIGMQIAASPSATPITDPNTLTMQATQTKSPFILALGSAAAGKTVYFAGRWITRKGLVGPWSPIVPFVVAG